MQSVRSIITRNFREEDGFMQVEETWWWQNSSMVDLEDELAFEIIFAIEVPR